VALSADDLLPAWRSPLRAFHFLAEHPGYLREQGCQATFPELVDVEAEARPELVAVPVAILRLTIAGAVDSAELCMIG
jgi:hypothetical protein